MVAQVVKTGLDVKSVAALARTLHGEILEPGMERYEERRTVWNAAYDRHPALIVRPADAADVQATVKWAVANGIQITVRSGGHAFTGAAALDGAVMIDLGSLNAVAIDVERNIANAQTGLLFRDLIAATQVYGLAIPGGKLSTVGVGGAGLGGGVGWLARKHGLAIDHIRSAEIVTADGSLLRVSRDSHPDLFWAIRGGGGNFGIVTSIEFAMVPVNTIYGGLIGFPMSDAVSVLRNYREFLKDSQTDLTTIAAMMPTPDGGKMLGLAGCFIGNAEAGEKAFQPLVNAGTPVMVQLGEAPYGVMLSSLDDAAPAGLRHSLRAGYLRQLSDATIDSLVDGFINSPAHSVILIEQYGGKINEVAPDATAFPHRKEELGIVIEGIWTNDNEEQPAREWMLDTWNRVQPDATGGVYVGFLDKEGPERVRAAYGNNYYWLTRVKGTYDPGNVFRANQNIPPAL